MLERPIAYRAYSEIASREITYRDIVYICIYIYITSNNLQFHKQDRQSTRLGKLLLYDFSSVIDTKLHREQLGLSIVKLLTLEVDTNDTEASYGLVRIYLGDLRLNPDP